MASSQDEFLSPEEAARANRHAITSELPYSIRRFDRESVQMKRLPYVEAFNVLTITYKTANDLYEKDKKHLGKLMQMVQSSVSMHYKDTCCNPERPLQHWIATLYVTAGDDDRHEQDQARDRYHKALQPMRNPNNWELWLVRYDEAASYAQKNGVVQVSSLNAIIKDFVTAVTKVAENWTSNFLDPKAFPTIAVTIDRYSIEGRALHDQGWFHQRPHTRRPAVACSLPCDCFTAPLSISIFTVTAAPRTRPRTLAHGLTIHRSSVSSLRAHKRRFKPGNYGRDDPRMTRKEIMRKLRVQMTNKYPNRLQLRSNTK
ncbi:hypothetical protein E4U35_008033 [Claviceps purpurea]|nr:hypothetical protein E4U35_008033 [Claviceps purpurea]